MNIEKLNQGIKDALHSRGWEDREIESMNVHTAFCEYCMWHGLRGWGTNLLITLENLGEASEDI